jgi:hypothetical protein
MSARWAEEGDTSRSMLADLENRPALVADVLSVLPTDSDDTAGEVVAGLRSGVPVMVWPRADCDPDEFRAAVHRLLHEGPGTVLGRLRQLRAEAHQSGTPHVGRHLVVLWDDPQRVIGSAVSPRRESGPSTA